MDIDTEPASSEGEFLFTIEVPENSIRQNIDRLHFVLYDANDQVLAHRTHSSGQAESLEFYHEFPLVESERYSLARITDFKDEVFTVRLYKDLTGTQLRNGIQLQRNATDRSTNIIDLPITALEEGHSVWAQGTGYSLITSEGRLSGNFSSDYANGLGSDNLLLLCFGEDTLSDYKYLFIPSAQLVELGTFDASIFMDEATRYRHISFYKPYSRTLIKIRGYEDDSRFKANIGHTIHGSNYLSDFGGITYSYPDFFYQIVSSVQLENYEREQVGPIPEDLILPEAEIDYGYANGLISFNGLPDYEVSRFLLRASGQIHVTFVVVADGDSKEITIPELPADLFTGQVGEGLRISRLSLQQGAAENYEGYTTYSDYISNTLIIDQPYYLKSPSRERIFKSSVSSQLLPF